MSMTRARITIARQRAKAIAAAVPGLASSLVSLGMTAPEDAADDETFWAGLRSKEPASLTILTSALTLHFSGSVSSSETVLHLTAEMNVVTPFYIKIDDEIMLLQAGDNFSDAPVLRGQLGTTAAAHADISTATLFEVMTATVDQHSFKAGQVLTLSIGALNQDYAVTVLEVSATTIKFQNPQAGAASPVTLAEGDLLYSLKVAIKAAMPRSYKVGEQMGESAVEVLLYFGVEYATQTFISIESVAMALRDALALSSNWANYNDGPDDVEMEEPKLERATNPVPGFYKYTLLFNGV